MMTQSNSSHTHTLSNHHYNPLYKTHSLVIFSFSPNTLHLNFPKISTTLFRILKLEFVVFDSQPLEWLFQSKYFFNFYQLSSENMLSLTTFYMKGISIRWFMWIYENHRWLDLFTFRKVLKLCFSHLYVRITKQNYLN